MTSLELEPRERLEIRTDADVVGVRQIVRAVATHAGLSLVDQTKLVTAASELARNTLIHGGGGEAAIDVVEEKARRGVLVVFSDKGAGIPDVELALTDGWTTGSGLGLGLPGARRLVDHFELATEVGCGTQVSIVKWGR